MVSNKAGAHDDDEPLLPLISDSGYSKQHQHTTVSSVKLKEISTSSTSHHHHHKEDDEILTSSSLSGSTAHESLPEVHDHHHDHSQGHSHSHGHGHGHSHGHSHSHSHTHGAHDHHHPVTGARTSTPNSIVSIESAEDDAPTLAEIQESEKDKRRLKIAIALCSTFFCVELAGGLLADSLALLSDSFHLLTGKILCSNIVERSMRSQRQACSLWHLCTNTKSTKKQHWCFLLLTKGGSEYIQTCVRQYHWHASACLFFPRVSCHTSFVQVVQKKTCSILTPFFHNNRYHFIHHLAGCHLLVPPTLDGNTHLWIPPCRSPGRPLLHLSYLGIDTPVSHGGVRSCPTPN